VHLPKRRCVLLPSEDSPAASEVTPGARGRAIEAWSGSIDVSRDEHPRLVTAAGEVIGALLGMAGSFAPSAPICGLAWAWDPSIECSRLRPI